VDLTFPGWRAVGDDAGLLRKIAACERITQLALKFTERDPPVRLSPAGAPPPGAAVMPQAVYEEFGRAVKTFRACSQLASTGYGQSALILAAVVLQSSLIVMWAIEQGESVDAKADLHMQYGVQLGLEARRRVGLWKSLPDADDLSAEERKEAKALFGPEANGLWTGHHSLVDLIDDLESLEEDRFSRAQVSALKIMLADAESMLSGTGIANQSQRVVTTLEDGRKAMRVNVGFGSESCSNALHMASGVLLSAVDAMVRNYYPDLAEDVRRCEAFMWRAWKDPQELSGLADTDLCPCDRPGTLWGECHKWTEELGTIRHVPFTDADLINFVPSDPSIFKPPLPDVDTRNGSALHVPEGPVVLTFTFRLPFTLGLKDEGYHDISCFDSWADPDDVAHFGMTPIIRIRLFNQSTSGLELWPPHAPEALRHFYGDLDDPPSLETFKPIPGAYEQWVTIETPSGRMESESEYDRAYAFHRGLDALNNLLRALELAESDKRISSVSTHEIGSVVFRGAILPDGKWMQLGDLIMHPDSFPLPLEPQSFEAMGRQVDSAISNLRDGRLFLTSNLWSNRAVRAFNLRGDAADCVVSIQTAAESMMYDLLRGILVDLGKMSSEISKRVNADLSFRSVLTREIPPRLGGDWSLTDSNPVGRYWNSVYLLRNRVVHGGYAPTDAQASSALDLYFNLREYVSELLWRKSTRYPRTLLAKVGENGLVRRGWMSASMRKWIEAFGNEPAPFYWPKDVARR
jgi:hypothetical protein